MNKLSNPEIDNIEKALGYKLPGLYRKLLVEEGFGILPNGASEIYDPKMITKLCEEFFSKQTKIFCPFVPFGSNRNFEKIWVINSLKESVANAPVHNKPYDLAKANLRWLSYYDWAEKYFDPCLTKVV